MDEPQRERDPESYFGAGIGGGSGLFTAGGTSDGPHSPAPAAPSVATVTEPAREIPVHEETDVLVHGDLTGGLGDRSDGRYGGRRGVRPIRHASCGEQCTSSADPGAEVALWIALALWLVHCSLI